MSKPAFDPNKPFSVGTKAVVNAAKPPFDPNRPFEASPEEKLSTVNQLGGVIKESLPMIGGAIGGAVGLIGGPVGAVAGGGIGAMGGEVLRQGIDRLQGNAPTSLKQAYADQLSAGLSGAAGEAFGLSAAKVLSQPLKSTVASFTPNLLKSSARAGMSQAADVGADAAARVGGQFSAEPSSISQSLKLGGIRAPRNIEELKNVKTPDIDMPNLTTLKRVSQNLAGDLNYPPLELHAEMLKDPKAMKSFKIKFDSLPSEDATALAKYNYAMLEDAKDIAKQTAAAVSSNRAANIDEAFDLFRNTALSKYNTTKESLSPIFKDVTTGAKRLDENQTFNIIDNLTKKTGVENLVDIIDGKITVKSGGIKSGLSKVENDSLKEVVEALNDGASISELAKIREALRKRLNNLNPQETAKIQDMRKVLIDEMERIAETKGPQFKEAMKGWAINEKGLDSVEKILGGNLDSLDESLLADPKTLQKVFASKTNADTVKNFIGEEPFQDLIRFKLESLVNQSIDSVEGFKPHILKKLVKQNSDFIRRYAPEAGQKLLDAADYGYLARRFLDDVNPSGTAGVLADILEPTSVINQLKTGNIKGAITAAASVGAIGKIQQKAAVKALNESLGEVTQKSPLLQFGEDVLSAGKSGAKQVGNVGARVIGQELGRVDFKVEAEQKRGPEKWAAQGAQRIIEIDPTLEQVVIDLYQTPQGKKILQNANGVSASGVQKIIEQIRPKEIQKTVDPKKNYNFPLKVKNNGMIATVSNEEELEEALSEGWSM